MIAQTNTYILNGAAKQNTCNCYTLTPAVNTQNGSVWNARKISLANAFDFSFNVFLGCADAAGADGIVFILQPVSTSIGSTGEGMGFNGIAPSIGISLDTYQNTNLNDPAFDHISIQANGNITHGNDLAGPVPVSSTSDNVEDCQWHVLRISWDPVSRWLRAYFDNVLRVETQVDLIGTIFNNDPMVYWGFSAATGGSNNLQQFCTALNPDFKTNFTNNNACAGNQVQFFDQSTSFTQASAYFWDFGDGTTSNLQNPLPHTYALPGKYDVKLGITALDGCKSDTITRPITIGSIPDAAFEISDACFKKAPAIQFTANNVGTTNHWVLNGASLSTSQLPVLNNLAAGNYSLKQVVNSLYGCGAPAEVTRQFTIYPLPVVDAVIADGCVNVNTPFTGIQSDNQTTISQWNWLFANGQRTTTQNFVQQYNRVGQYTAQVWAIADNGCTSDTVTKSFTISQAIAFAGNDTIVLKNVPFPLNGLGGISYSWSPVTGLNDPLINNPVSVLQDDISYVLTVKNTEGCVAADTVNITVFKGSAVYVPTGFTPNHDGLNDVLRPRYIGIKKLDYFTVYNRWGEKVFSTTNTALGWNGTYKGIDLPTGSFVWMIKAEDVVGKIYQLKGTTTIIR